MENAAYWINRLQLVRHPEGGYFREIYRSSEIVNKKHLPDRYSGFRNFSTSIYFLLESHEFSAFHRIKSDETWHFYTGAALDLITINPSGVLSEYKLGRNSEHGEVFQLTITKGIWFMARVGKADSFSLAGCTVAPGFDFDDFELARKDDLLKKFPQHESFISRFCIR